MHASKTTRYLPLLATLKEMQTRVHGLRPDFWDTNDVFITTGSLDGINKAMEMAMAEGDPIIFHEPCYSGASEVVSTNNKITKGAFLL
jgi:DNA-binding transcriptional MocR family regulator